MGGVYDYPGLSGQDGDFMGNLNASVEGSTSAEKGESLNLLLELRITGDFSAKRIDHSNPFPPSLGTCLVGTFWQLSFCTSRYMR